MKILEKKLDFDSDNVIKYILLTSFVSLGDRSRFNNEDYGLDSIINKWKYIPYDHDLSFFCDSSPITNLVSELKSSGEEWANNRERTYDIIREIYDNPNNLYRMLEAIDKYPFRANKIKMKNEIKFRFYYSALYYGSREFAEELGVAHIPFNNKALYIREAEKIIEHEDNFDDLCSLSNSYRYSELSRLITQLSECQEGQFEIEDIEKSKTYIINGLKIELSSINKQDQNVNVLLIINDYNRVFLDNRNSAEHVSLVGKSYTIELVSSNENSITIKISCGYQGICEDSDGGINYYDLGISSDGKNSIEDRCVDDNKLIESVCNDNKVDTVEYECPDGCTNGYCKYFCIDSDGGVNSEVKGSAHSNGRVLFREVLKESDETKVLSSTKAQIKVRWNENIIDLELGQTIDIGLIEIFIKEINIISPNNIDNNVVIEFLRLNDFCYMGSLLEATCELNGKSNFVEKVCVNGCKDGACVQNELACKDSDNGLDYFTEGNVTLNNIEKTDYCTVSGGVFNTITEYSCNNGIIDESIYRCPNDCVIDVDGSVLGSCKLEKEICDNKIDDDNDEKKDCDDNDCLNDPLCKAVPVQAVEKTCVVGFSESKELRELQGVVINEEYVGLLSADENNGKITAIITTSGKTYTLTDTSRSVEVTVNNKKYKVELVSSTDSNSNIKVSSCT